MPSVTASRQLSPPSFFQLAGNPVRWRLMSELARSDLRVGELCSRLELPQNLVSYHLGKLRGERMVANQRSAADGRDSYYTLDLGRCRELLVVSGGALHPGLQLAPPMAHLGRRGRRGGRPPVLFLCTGNSARSQIAEALVQHLSGGAIIAYSAGSDPKPLHANAVRVMAERGIDIEGRRSKHLRRFTGRRLAYVITLCDRVREVCPEFPDHPHLVHWSIPDPASEGSNDQETYPAFERTARELETRIPFLLQLIDHPRATRR
ncbi:MAG: ArsR family transcriptional regulator [Solirubrobacterales bacterium]|nr:ArsR family transcriptional regulator [Solirubrobacterales bacterium]